MNVAELLTTPLMSGAQVVSGSKGVLREVTWAVPDADLRFENWIMPGLLLVYTDRGRSDCDRPTFLVNLLDKDPAGVVIFPGQHCSIEHVQDIPEEVIELHESYDLPLIFIDRRVSALGFLKRFASTANIWFNAEDRRIHWLEEICCSTDYSGAEFMAISNGYNPAYSYYASVLSFRHKGRTTLDDMEISMARGFLGRELSFKEAPVLSFELNGDVVAFIPREQEEERSRFRRRIDKAMAKPHGEVSASKWRIAIGTRAWSVSEFNESFNNAFKTKGVTSQLNVTDRVAYFRDWYMHMLLLDQPRKQLEEQMRHELEPILDAADLLETLTNYLVFGENLKVTSEKTYIHVNTLKYRLKRISELLCCDLKDPTVRFRLRMAITMYRFLEKGEA